jgi:DNA repair photolyase
MKVSVCTNREILSPCGLKELDYQVDTYVGCEHYCYYCYALAQAETDW